MKTLGFIINLIESDVTTIQRTNCTPYQKDNHTTWLFIYRTSILKPNTHYVSDNIIVSQYQGIFKDRISINAIAKEKALRK